MPAEQRGDEIRGAEEVEAPGEDGARDAVEGGCVPGDLRPVDAEVGGDGAVEALRGEDGVGVGLGGVLGCCWSGWGGNCQLG